MSTVVQAQLMYLDSVDNMELVDLDVYVEICGQLLNKTKTLPDGAVIGDITIK